jgi:hypothetical protein
MATLHWALQRFGSMTIPPGKISLPGLARVVERKSVELGYSRLYLFTHVQEHFYAEQGWTYMEPTEWGGLNCSIMWRVPRGGDCIVKLQERSLCRGVLQKV